MIQIGEDHVYITSNSYIFIQIATEEVHEDTYIISGVWFYFEFSN